MPVYGTDVELSVCFQDSFDTIASIANSAQSIAVINESFNAQQPLLNSEGIRNRVDRGDAYAGSKEVTGELECEVLPKSIGFLLKSVADRTASVNSGSLYTHTFKLRQAQDFFNSVNAPMTLTKKWGGGANDVVNYYNLNASGFEFSCAAGEFLRMKIPFIGGRNDNGTTGHTAAYPNELPYSWDQSSISINSNVGGNIKSISINVDESAEARHTLCDSGDNWPNRVARSGFRTGTINLTMSFDTTSEYIAYRGDAATVPPFTQPVVATFTQGVEVQSGYNHQISFNMPKVVWETFEAPVTGAGEVEVNMSGKIKHNATDGFMLAMTLVDTKSAY